MPSSVCSIGFKPKMAKNSEKPGQIMCHKFLLKALYKFQISVLPETRSLLHLKSPCYEKKREKGEREGGRHPDFEHYMYTHTDTILNI